jgi:large subunit ribosomal protein L22
MLACFRCLVWFRVCSASGVLRRTLRQRFCATTSGTIGSSSSSAGQVPTEPAASTNVQRSGSSQIEGTQQTAPRTASAVARQVKISHRKLNVVCSLVRRLSVSEAERQLAVCRKKGARILLKLLHQAMANARNNHQMDLARTFVRESFVGKGQCFKILRPWHGKGRFAFHEKKYSHATIILEEANAAQDSSRSRDTRDTGRGFSWSAHRKAVKGERPLPPLPAVWNLTVDPSGIYRNTHCEPDDTNQSRG